MLSIKKLSLNNDMADFTTKPVLQNKVNKEGLAPLYIRYTYNRNPQQIATGLKVNPEFWDSKKGVVKSAHPEAAVLNNKIRNKQSIIEDVASGIAEPEYQIVKEAYLKRLDEIKEEDEKAEKEAKSRKIKNVAKELYNTFDLEDTEEQILEYQQKLQELLQKKKELNTQGFKNDSFESLEFKRLLKLYPEELIKITDKSRGSIKTWSKILLEFAEKTNTILTFDIFNQAFYNKYAKYLMKDSKHNYFNANFGKHVKHLKAFLRHCETEHGKQVNRSYTRYKVLKEEKEIVFLTEEELELLWNYQDKVRKPLVKHIHLFYFQNATGLRYSDIKRSLWAVEGEVLTGKTQKTGGVYQIPFKIDSRIKEILEMYNYNLNLVTEQKFNKNIKEICKALFEHHEINNKKIPIIRKKLADESVVYHDKWELLTSHSGRRGFATRMYHKGYNERSILLMMGSRSNEVLKKYIRNNREDMLKTVDQIEDRKVV